MKQRRSVPTAPLKALGRRGFFNLGDEMAKSAGRPKNLENVELLELDEAIVRAQEYLNLSRPPFVKRTLQNKICAGQLERYGTYHIPMVDWNELKRTLTWRKKKSA